MYIVLDSSVCLLCCPLCTEFYLFLHVYAPRDVKWVSWKSFEKTLRTTTQDSKQPNRWKIQYKNTGLYIKWFNYWIKDLQEKLPREVTGFGCHSTNFESKVKGKSGWNFTHSALTLPFNPGQGWEEPPKSATEIQKKRCCCSCCSKFETWKKKTASLLALYSEPLVP